MILIWYPKCSTCQKAKNYLEYKAIPFTVRDIVFDIPTESEMIEFIHKSGLNINKFFNTSGMKYRELGLKDKLVSMSDKEKIKLLCSDGMLIKRPLLITDKKVYIGFKEKEWSELL